LKSQHFRADRAVSSRHKVGTHPKDRSQPAAVVNACRRRITLLCARRFWAVTACVTSGPRRRSARMTLPFCMAILSVRACLPIGTIQSQIVFRWRQKKTKNVEQCVFRLSLCCVLSSGWTGRGPGFSCPEESPLLMKAFARSRAASLFVISRPCRRFDGNPRSAFFSCQRCSALAA
jgi:hypothetical protein